MTINILVATHYLEGSGVAEAIEALDRRLVVRRCRYVESAEMRGARSRPGVTVTSPPPGPRQRAELARADVLVALDVPAELPRLAGRLRWCHLISSGTGHLAGSGLPIPPVAVTHSPGGNAAGVAEFVLARIFEHAKLFPDLAALQRAGKWEPTAGGRIEGKTLTVVGFGHIGREVARRARAMGMAVRAVARRPTDPDIDGVDVTTELEPALDGADAVVVCAADRPENRHLIGPQAFAAISRGALFVNVSRGSLVDEEALLAALRSGRLAAAALDVTEVEPLPAAHPFWSMPNVRLSFHSASTQDGALPRRLEMFTANLRRWLAGEPLRDVVVAFSGTDTPALP